MEGLRFVVSIISTNRAVKKLFDSVLYTNIVKCFGATGWMFDDKNVRSVLVKLTVEDRDKFCLDTKQLNWDSCLEIWVEGVRGYIVKEDRSILLEARKHCELQVHKQQITTIVKHWWQKQRSDLYHT